MSESPETRTGSDERVQLRVRAPDLATAERVMAEAWSEGALGIEEREDDRGVVMVVYLPAGLADACSDALLTAFADEGVTCEAAEALPDEDWSEAWKDGLGPIVVSERLVVRPSFVTHTPGPGQRELIVDPRRAFGTGGHVSTRLALDWIDAMAAERSDMLWRADVLDVGVGSGVLAMATLLLGARHAVGFDLDADAVEEAVRGAGVNGLTDRLELFSGGIARVAGRRFTLVLANLLRTEMLPIADAIAAAVAPDGGLVLSGLLEADGPAVDETFTGLGLVRSGEIRCTDANGDVWIAPRFVRPSE